MPLPRMTTLVGPGCAEATTLVVGARAVATRAQGPREEELYDFHKGTVAPGTGTGHAQY